MASITAFVALVAVQAGQPAPAVAQASRTAEEQVRVWAAADTSAFWPYWAQGKGIAWITTGVAGTAEEALFGHDAAAGSTAWPFTLSIWARDDETGEWLAAESRAPRQVPIELRSGYLPLPRVQWSGRALSVQLEYQVAGVTTEFPSGIAVLRARVTNTSSQPRGALLAVAVRPYLVDGRVGTVRSLDWERDVVWVNDSIPVAPDRVPADRVVADLECGGRDLSRVLMEDQALPPCTGTGGDLRAGAFLFPLSLAAGATENVAILAPMSAVRREPSVVPEFRRLGTEELAARAAAHWRARLLDLPFEVPDTAVMNAVRANLAYASIALDPGALAGAAGVEPDAVPYVLAALLRARVPDAAVDLAVPYLERPTAAEGPAQAGQAIYSAAELVRFTADTTFARRAWPAVRERAERIRRARAPMAHDSMRGGPGFGILPASVAPPHLGTGDGHHYWDDFWAIRGLRDAEWLAGVAGESGEARWMDEEADALERAVRSSYRQLMLVTRIGWIPDGPEEVESAAIARSTCAGVWPAAGIEPRDTIVRRSFDRYWEKFVAPHDGAFLHGDAFRPRALAIAACEVRLDRPERAHVILRWHLRHPTLPGTHAWAERVDTATLGYAGGAMPDPWAAADLVSLVRSLLIYERGDTLVLGAGIPMEWLRAGAVELRGAPSAVGPVTLRARAAADGRGVVWEVLDAGRASALVLTAPVGHVLREARVDDAWMRSLGNVREVVVPAGVRRVELRVAKR